MVKDKDCGQLTSLRKAILEEGADVTGIEGHWMEASLDRDTCRHLIGVT
jgi:hypothetical protein